jgi:hypothetical protein
MIISEILLEDEDGRTMKNPMKFISAEDEIFGQIHDMADETEHLLKSNGRPVRVIKNVPMSSIICTEPTLDPDNVKKPRNLKPPYLIEHKGKFYVQDGNHRVVRAYLDGKKSIKANVIEIPSGQQMFKVMCTVYPYAKDKVVWDNPIVKQHIEVQGEDLDDIWPRIKKIETPSNGHIKVVDKILDKNGRDIYD